MSDALDTITRQDVHPELYVRANITKNTKGYQAETTASVRASMSADEIEGLLRGLLAMTDRVTREEIAVRSRMDADGEGRP
jgi:hypothetical protein